MLGGAAIVICIQSKYTAGGRQISREGRFIHGGVEREVLLEGHSIPVPFSFLLLQLLIQSFTPVPFGNKWAVFIQGGFRGSC